MISRELAVIGVSAGGLEAVSTILRLLPASFGLALVVVQHRSKDSSALCELLQDCAPIPVSEASDKEPIRSGHVYVAAADYHLLIEGDHFALSLDEPELYSRPSIDLCFESAAHSFGPRAVGAVLTGANADGSRGLRVIVARGGEAIVQDPATAEVPTMPEAALAAVPTARVLTLQGIASYLAAVPTPPRVSSEDAGATLQIRERRSG